MNIEFNYKRVHFYLLSIFSILLILSLTNAINNCNQTTGIRNYSIFGIIFCLLAWALDEHIRNKITCTQPYYTNIIKGLLNDRVYIQWGLILVLLVVLILYVVILSLQDHPISDSWRYANP
jgi:hypothetical protein